MSKHAMIAVVIVVLLIMFVPVMLAESIERFFGGLGTMVDTWTK